MLQRTLSAGFIAPCLPIKAHERAVSAACGCTEALTGLRSRSCIIDGEGVACDGNGVASFDLVRHHRANDSVFLYAFDLIELNGEDLRPHAFFANLHKIFWFQFEPVIVASYFALSIQIGRRSSQYNS